VSGLTATLNIARIADARFEKFRRDQQRDIRMITIINVADLQDPNDPQGRSYRQVNAARTHAIPLGTLVEIESGERLYVKWHGRDCDQTPLYSLGLADEEQKHRWDHGHAEESLTVVAPHCDLCGGTGEITAVRPATDTVPEARGVGPCPKCRAQRQP
jgi:hypothetical protein